MNDNEETKWMSPGICLKCGSENVDFGDVEYQSNINWQDCKCKDCGCYWAVVIGMKSTNSRRKKSEIVIDGVKRREIMHKT